jgi:thymidylate synthase ThyX
MNFIDLRDAEHAQWEIRQYAIAMKDFMLELFPETSKIWFEVNKK